MPKAKKRADDTTLYVRGFPGHLSRKLKAAAAIEGESLTAYVVGTLEAHVADLEKRGLLPRPKP